MQQNRISSILTLYYSWVLPMLSLSFGTIFTIWVLILDLSEGLSGYLLVYTTILWILYLITKPWRYIKLYENDDGLIIVSSKGNILLSYENIKSVKSLFPFKHSPIIIKYQEDNKPKELKFISRLSSPLFSIPFAENDVVQMIKDKMDESLRKV